MPLSEWDLRFLKIAKEVSTWSKDPGTKVGVVLVKSRRIVSTGYNGFPVGISDDPIRYLDRETKLRYTIHAEINAILNAAKNGSRTEGCTLYTTFFPCISCTTAIIQGGIHKVVTPSIENSPVRWRENFHLSKNLLIEANIEIEEFNNGNDSLPQV
jgi:dCMP deaminase